MTNTVSEFNVLEIKQNSIYDVSELISKTKVDARRLQFANVRIFGDDVLLPHQMLIR